MRAAALIVPVLALALGACAEIDPPRPNEILESPFGKGALRLGMSKSEVRELWGEPSSIEEGEADRWGVTRETWVYDAAFGGGPDVGYAARSKTLEFNGESLTAFHD